MTWWRRRKLDEDPCRVLGITLPPAGSDLDAWKKGALKARWKAVAKELHPDLQPEAKKEEARIAFTRASAAHEALVEISSREAWPPPGVGNWDDEAEYEGWTHAEAAENLQAFHRMWEAAQERRRQEAEERRCQAEAELNEWIEEMRLDRERAQAKLKAQARAKAKPPKAGEPQYDGPDRSSQPPPQAPGTPDLAHAPTRVKLGTAKASKPVKLAKIKAPRAAPKPPPNIMARVVTAVETLVVVETQVRQVLGAEPSGSSQLLKRIRKVRKALG